MMRKRNWREYNKHLVQEGSISFLICPKTYRLMQHLPASTGRGRPVQYSDKLIKMLLLLKIRFRLPYRALEGFARSLFEGKKLKVPTYTLICKRLSQLEATLPKQDRTKHEVIILDASGMKVYGEGEWKRKIHGRGRPRKWVKLHIAIDEKTQEIVSQKTTESAVTDGQVTEYLLKELDGVKKVLADGAYDGKKSRGAILRKGGKDLVPPPKNARYRKSLSERDKAIASIRGLGGDKLAKSIWGKLSGYSRRVLVETAFSRMKRRFGERLFSKRFDHQILENTCRCELLNMMRMGQKKEPCLA